MVYITLKAILMFVILVTLHKPAVVYQQNEFYFDTIEQDLI